jgi:peptidoglycan/xylan/chitin deacetylase (PgdA/CDA1 family)
MAGKRAALCLTFDNLGEAAELELGLWPGERPVGAHPSVTRALPRILDALGGLRATFFVEGWNARVYPDALGEIAARGHETALHGWRHEIWRALSPERERELLARGAEALRGPAGFRPPGGAGTAATGALLAELGFSYASSAEGDCALPFAWTAVDAYYLDPLLAPVRERLGAGRDPLSLARWREALGSARGVVVFHPYLLVRDDAFEVFAEFAAGLAGRDDIRALTCRDAVEARCAST